MFSALRRNDSVLERAGDLALIDRSFEGLHDYLRDLTERSESERYAHWGFLKPDGNPVAKSERIRRELAAWMGVPKRARRAIASSHTTAPHHR